jgi:multidrug efflux pump
MQPVQDIQIGARVSRTQYQYTLVDTDAAELAKWLPLLVDRLRASPELSDVTSDQQDSGFATEIVVDRDSATRLGVTMQSIEDVLYDAFGQRQISTIFSQSNQYRVVMEADPAWIADPNSLLRLRVPGTVASIGANGAAATASTTVATTNTVAQVPLTAVARIEKRVVPLVVTHQGQFPAATISFNVRPGAALGDAVDAVSAAEASIGLPDTISGSYAGDAAEFQRSLAAEPWLILAAVAVIYIVLGVLYESFIHPITILSTLPSAGIGALLALMVTGADLSIVALVGISRWMRSGTGGCRRRMPRSRPACCGSGRS